MSLSNPKLNPLKKLGITNSENEKGKGAIELLTGNPPYYNLNQYSALCRIVEDDSRNNFRTFKGFFNEILPIVLLKHREIRTQNQIAYNDIINS